MERIRTLAAIEGVPVSQWIRKAVADRVARETVAIQPKVTPAIARAAEMAEAVNASKKKQAAPRKNAA